MGGLLAIGAFALGIGLWLYWRRLAPKTTTALFLVAGLTIGGWIGSLLGWVLNTIMGTLGTVTGQLIGYGASTILAVVALVATLEVVVKGLWKKKAAPQRFHPWLALALPTIVIAFGLPIMVTGMSAVTGVVEQAGATLTTGGDP